MGDIFRRIKSLRLQGHLVWIPMLPADNLEAALAQGEHFQDERITQYWDKERCLGRQVAQILSLNALVAWDIYLLYTPDQTWESLTMPVPDFWMHQLDERVDLLLEPGRLMGAVQKAIEIYSYREFFDD